MINLSFSVSCPVYFFWLELCVTLLHAHYMLHAFSFSFFFGENMEFLCEWPQSTWSMLELPRKWLHPAAPHKVPLRPPSSARLVKEIWSYGRAASCCPKPLHLPRLKRPHCSLEARGVGAEGVTKESHEARPPGQRLPRRWALGTLPKTTRRRGSQTQSISVWSAVGVLAGTLPLFSSAVGKKTHTVT